MGALGAISIGDMMPVLQAALKAKPQPEQAAGDDQVPPALGTVGGKPDLGVLGSITDARPTMPQSILGNLVPEGEQIPEKKMGLAEKAFGGDEHAQGKIDYEEHKQDLKDDERRIDYLTHQGLISPNDSLRQHGLLEEEKLQYEKEHPWGAAESAHPGVLGKILHGLSVAGQAGAAALLPGGATVESMVPGSILNRQIEEQGALGKVEQGTKGMAEEATAKAAGAKEPNPEADAYRAAVQQRIAKGENPLEAAVSAYTDIQQAKQDTKPEKVAEGDKPVSDVDSTNKALERRFQILNPGKPLPDDLKLKPNATNKEFDRIDKLMQQTEQAQGVKANQDAVKAARDEAHAAAQGAKTEAAATKSYNVATKAVDDLRKPVREKADKIDTALTNTNLKTAQADALVAPELLSVMAGGSGSGLRMNEAEIKRITGGRSSKQDLIAIGQKLASGQSITDDQRAQVVQILTAAKAKIEAKQTILQKAQHDLDGAESSTEHRRISSEAKDAVEKIDDGKYITADEARQLGDKDTQALVKKGYILVQ